MWENSLVVFHSDNGGEIMAKGQEPEDGKGVGKGSQPTEMSRSRNLDDEHRVLKPPFCCESFGN